MSNILITGATGHLGKATISALLNKGVNAGKIAALVRNEKKAQDLKEMGIKILVADYEDYNSLVKAFACVDQLLFISGSDVMNRNQQQQNVVKAAVEVKVKHVIYTSALNRLPIEQSAISFVSQAHVKTEKWLAESGLNYTILQNSLYADVIPQFIGDVLNTQTIYLPAAQGKTAFVVRTDIAEAAAAVLTSDGHNGKTYKITNTESYTYQNVADIISDITGKSITYISPTVEDFTATLENAGLPAETISGFTAFALAQANDEFNVTGTDLEVLLNRKPTNLKEYLIDIYAK